MLSFTPLIYFGLPIPKDPKDSLSFLNFASLGVSCTALNDPFPEF